jgi:AcrR family transcriptional regulator
MTRGARPRQGTRPRNRRALILAAASELFSAEGYSRVSMEDIAEAVAISPSALYRHVRGKRQLLTEVVLDAFASIRVQLETRDPHDFDLIRYTLAAAALDNPHLGVLWRRESRHLDMQERARLRTELVAISRLVNETVRLRRPELDDAATDLLAWAAMGALMSVSHQHVELARADYEDLFTDIVGDVVATELPDGATAAVPVPSGQSTRVVPESTRELLLTEGIRLFAERGFHSVGVDDIGAAVGIAGAGLYHHFPSKADLLLEAMGRGAQQLHTELDQALAKSDDTESALRELIGSYVHYCLANHELVDLLITDTTFLEEPNRQRLRAPQQSYVREWVRLQGAPDEAAARVRAQAVLILTSDVARTPHLRALPAAERSVRAIGESILHQPQRRGSTS